MLQLTTSILQLWIARVFLACGNARSRGKLTHISPNECEHLTLCEHKGQLNVPSSPEEQGVVKPVWILLVQDNLMEVMQSMTAAGTIRTDLSDIYHISGCQLGKGSFAEAYTTCPRSKQRLQGRDEDDQNLANVVAKVFITSRFGQAQRAKGEAAALMACGPHPNIVSFHGIFASNFDTGKQWTLLLKYCEGGSLLDCLRAEGAFKTALAKQLATSMLLSLAHIYSMGYMHRDVKPENILLTATRRFVLGDFGSAVQIPEGQLSRQCFGTPGYLALEVFKQTH